MTPALPHLDALPLPAPAWLLWLLLTLTFVLHVVPMNLVLGGSIIGLVSRLRARRQPHAAALAALIAGALPVLIAAAVSMGVAALLFLQVLYGRLFFTSAVLLAGPWIAVIPVLIVAYYAAYAGRSSGQPLLAWVVAVSFALIAFVYANTMGLMLRPAEFLARFQASASGVHLNLGDPTLAPRYLHVLLASLAVSGLAVSLAGAMIRRTNAEAGEWMARHGAYWCAACTVLNFLPGFWWLAALPPETLLQFMGRSPAATACLALAVLAALGAIGLAVPAGFAAPPRGLVFASASTLLLSVVLMVLVRDFARGSILRAAGVHPNPWVVTQWGPIAVFGVLLLAAIATVWWMVAKLAKSRKPAETVV